MPHRKYMASKGLTAYHAFYKDVYGDRWEALFEALKAPAHQVERENKFHKEHPKLAATYKMDPASILAATALQVESGDQVLDMCAAPGGKSLVLCESLGSGTLVANELSENRRIRLLAVLKQYLPATMLKKISVKGSDGNKYGLKMRDTFDRILLDAPCSGDRHLVQKPSSLEKWSPKSPKSMAIRQYSLLASAFNALKPGGTLVYSTCAISPLENDGVIDKLFKKKPEEFRILRRPQELGEPTTHGHILLPDKHKAGPIYFSIIKKL